MAYNSYGLIRFIGLDIVIIGTLGMNILFFFGRYEFPEKKKPMRIAKEKGVE
jgi:hypothetical protein